MAIEIKDVEHLAGLARIAVSDSEKELFRRDLEEILAYVSKVKEVAGGKEVEKFLCPRHESADSKSKVESGEGELYNIMREDDKPHESGMFTEDLLVAAPAREGNRVFVKKIL